MICCWPAHSLITEGRIVFSNSLSAELSRVLSVFKFSFDIAVKLNKSHFNDQEKYLRIFVYTNKLFLPSGPMKTSESRYCKCMYFVSGALSRKIEKLATESWKKVGLSPSHAYLLMMVIEEPGVQPTDLSKELH